MEWFYATDGKQQGPVSREELLDLLHQGTVKANDYVWYDGMGDTWKRAADVPELGLHTPTGSTPEPGPPAFDAKLAPPLASGHISCTAPVGIAWDKMTKWLFKPFDMGMWFTLGFSAWLATLLQGSGGGGMSMPGDFSSAMAEERSTWGDTEKDFMGEALSNIWSTIAPYSALIAVLLIFFLAFFIFVLWAQCRGKFMFLDNVVNHRGNVKRPWADYAAHAHSLFIWNIGYGVVCLFVIGGCVLGLFLTLFMPIIRNEAFQPIMLLPIILLGLLLTLLSIANAYVMRFLEDFVVPIMYRHDLTVNEAWGKFRELSKGKMGALLVYGLFYFVLAMGFGTALVLIGFLTCCVGLCLMGLPYIGAVFTLPATLFFRVYSLQYLAQFGAEYYMLPEIMDAEPVVTN